MSKKKSATKQKEFETNVRDIERLYRNRDDQLSLESLNSIAAHRTWTGTYVGNDRVSTKRFGEVNRYLFKLESTDPKPTYSLLTNSETIELAMQLVLPGAVCEVYKSEKGEWRVLPISLGDIED